MPLVLIKGPAHKLVRAIHSPVQVTSGLYGLSWLQLIIRMETAKSAADRDAEAAERLQSDAERLLAQAGAARSRVETGATVARMEAAREVATGAAKAHAAVTRAARAALVEAQMAEREDARSAATAASATAAAAAVAAAAVGGRRKEHAGGLKQDSDLGANGEAGGAVKDEEALAFADLTLGTRVSSKNKDTGTAGQGECAQSIKLSLLRLCSSAWGRNASSSVSCCFAVLPGAGTLSLVRGWLPMNEPLPRPVSGGLVDIWQVNSHSTVSPLLCCPGAAGKALKVGQSVLVKQLGKTGNIVELKPKKGIAVVQCGIMQLNVPITDLTTS